MIGMLDGSIKYYQDSTENYYNTIYTEKTGSNNPFDGIDVGTRAKIVIEFAMILTRH
jgi:hypothetical protein